MINLKPPFYKIEESYKVVFNNPDGQRVLKHLMHTAYMTQTSYAPGDPNETAHREGMRRLVLAIIKQLRMNTGDLKSKLEEIQDENDAFIRS